MGCYVEILFPLADIEDPTTRAFFVDGGSNQAYGPGTPSGQFGPLSRPHQIGTDQLIGAPSSGKFASIAEVGDLADIVSETLAPLVVVTTPFGKPVRNTNPGSTSIGVTMSVLTYTPAGALIVLPIYLSSALFTSQTAIFIVSDTQGNTYTTILNTKTNRGQVGAFTYCYNANPLSPTDTITIVVSRSDSSVWGGAYLYTGCGFFATGIKTSSDPHETSVDRFNAPSSGGSPVTSGTPSANSLMVGMAFGVAANTGVPAESTPPWIPVPCWSAVTAEQNGGLHGWTGFADGYIMSYCITSTAQTFWPTDVASGQSASIITAFAPV